MEVGSDRISANAYKQDRRALKKSDSWALSRRSTEGAHVGSDQSLVLRVRFPRGLLRHSLLRPRWLRGNGFR